MVMVGFARQITTLSFPAVRVKAGCRISLISLSLLVCAGSVHAATGTGDTRTLSFHHTHSGEDLTVTFKRNGRYDEAALKQLNHFLRDWRNQDETVMDRHLFDILWEVYHDVHGKQPIQIISSYRSPATNAMLHRRSFGVARQSQHTLGHAIDFFIPGVPLEEVRNAGLRLQRGGVGFYPTSGSPFVHLDTGSIRYWPRMTHEQLVKVFPDERTVHVPSDGVLLKGYDLAKADIEKRENGDDDAAFSKPSLLAALFKGNSAKTDDEDDAGAGETAAPAATNNRAADKVLEKPTDPVPLPRSRPQVAAALQLASADAQQVAPTTKPKPAPTPTAGTSTDARPQTPTDIINSRGFWDTSTKPQQATPAQVAALGARRALASVTNQQSTADQQPAAGVASSARQAMAYAPAFAADRSKVVTASAATVRPALSASATRSRAAQPTISNVAAKGLQTGSEDLIARPARISAAKGSATWLKVVALAPSASRSMLVTVMGNVDMNGMRNYFVKPETVIAMRFTDNPTPGLSSVSFSGSATAKLETTSFVAR